MKSRLAFSIASLVQPDILILDEVLSVGDGAFRKKSEAKMREIIHGGAATILVSHSMEDVARLRALGLYGAIIGKAYYTGDISLRAAVEAAR